MVEEKAKEVTHAKDDEVLADVRDLLDHLPDHGLLNPVLEHSHFSIFGLRVLLARQNFVYSAFSTVILRQKIRLFVLPRISRTSTDDFVA